MNQEPNPRLERELDQLLVSYRDACGNPEPSANFMPGVWARIDARRGWMWHARIYARRMAMAAGAACVLMLGVEVSHAWRAQESLISRGYVEVLRDAAATEDYAYMPAMEVAERF